MREFTYRVSNEVYLALNDMGNKDRAKISLAEMYIVVNRLDSFDKPTHVNGWKVLAGSVPSSCEYYLAFEDLDELQSKFLKCHENIVDEGLYDAGVRA